MIHFVEDDSTVSRVEREYFDYLFQENEDASQQHRIPIRAWDTQTKQFRRAFFYEPFDTILTAVFSELAPLYFKSQVFPVCQCHDDYQRLITTQSKLNSTTTLLQFTQQSFLDLKDTDVPQTVWKKLKDLKGQYFLSLQDTADTLLPLLRSVLDEHQIEDYGNIIMEHVQHVGMDNEFFTKKCKEVEGRLQRFHGNVPMKPTRPTEIPCPYCHTAYHYPFFEWIFADVKTFDRVKSLLLGDVPIPLSDIERCIEALELWIFDNHDHELFEKKRDGAQTIVGTMMKTIHLTYQEIKTEMTSNLSSSLHVVMPDASLDFASNSFDATYVPPVPDIPLDS